MTSAGEVGLDAILERGYSLLVEPSGFLCGEKLSGEVADALSGYGLPVLTSGTTQRVIYPSSAAEGQTVFTADPKGPATEEINAVMNETMEVLKHAQSKRPQPRLTTQTSRTR